MNEELNIIYKYNQSIKTAKKVDKGKIKISNGRFYIKGYNEYIEEIINNCEYEKNTFFTSIIKLTTQNDELYIAIPIINICDKFIIIDAINTMKLKNKISNEIL